MINDHTSLFNGKGSLNKIEQIVENNKEDKQILLDDLDQDLEIDVKRPKDSSKRQIITNVVEKESKAQVPLKNSQKCMLTSKSSNKS